MQYRSAPKFIVDGVILLEKETGISSNKALQQVKSLFNAKKAGHTGSLDPLATGLLPVCLGQATKVCSFLLDSHKKYETTIKLGETTDTLDSEGEVIETRPVNVTDQQIQEALEPFRGAIQQVPPMFSALKSNGQPLYKLARQGKSIERKPRDMFVHSLTAERLDELHVTLRVHCSSGFYIRSLVDDLGQALGCGAHVTQLRRTAIKEIDVSKAISFAKLKEMAERGDLENALLPIDSLIEHMPKLVITDIQLKMMQQGKAVPYEQPRKEGIVRFFNQDNALFAVGEMLTNGTLKTQRIFIVDGCQ